MSIQWPGARALLGRGRGRARLAFTLLWQVPLMPLKEVMSVFVVCADFSLLFTAHFLSFAIKAHFLERHTLNVGHCLCSALGSISEAAFSVL